MAKRMFWLCLGLITAALLTSTVGRSADKDSTPAKPRPRPPLLVTPTPPVIGLGGSFGLGGGQPFEPPRPFSNGKLGGGWSGNPPGGSPGCFGGNCGLSGCMGAFGGHGFCTSFQLPPPTRPLAFSPDGKFLALVLPGTPGTIGSSFSLMDTTTSKTLSPFARQPGRIDSVAFSPGGKALAIGGSEGTILWDRVKGKELGRFKGSAAVFSPDGKSLATWTETVVHIYEVAVGKELALLPNHPVQRFVPLTFTPDGRSLILKDANNQLFLWDVAAKSGAQPLLRSDDHFGALSPDGTALVFVTAARETRLCDLASDREIRRFDRAEPRQQWCPATLVFSPDGKTLVAACDDGRLRLWEVATGKEVRTTPTEARSVQALLVSPDGRKVALHQSNQPARLLDLTAIIPNARASGRPSPAVLQRLWDDLGGADSTRAYQAVYLLSAVPKEAVPFLRDRLSPVPAEATRRLAGLIADLDHDSFAVRQKASAELEKLGEIAEPALRRALAANPSLEVQWRTEKLLDKLHAKGPSAETLRALRATAALEYAGTPDSRQALETLAEGAPEARLTIEAKAALRRLRPRLPEPPRP